MVTDEERQTNHKFFFWLRFIYFQLKVLGAWNQVLILKK